MNKEFMSMIRGIKDAHKHGHILTTKQTNFLDRVQTANRHFRNQIHRETGITRVTHLREDEVFRLNGAADRKYAQRASAADAYVRQRAIALGKSPDAAVKRNQQTRKALATLVNLHTRPEDYAPEAVSIFKRNGSIPQTYPEVRRRRVVQRPNSFRVGANPVI